MIQQIDHIGIAVKSLDATVPYYRDALGLGEPHIEEVPTQKVRVAMFDVAKEAGLTVLNDPPVPGAHNTQVTFLHPKCTFGVLTEFCQHPGGCECGK